ncbi:restriction endonuclease subunit S [Fusobacterium polymorphum]|uniref:Type I site-specific deoxyribonuclease restriction subunit n=1 Tax=Fusobacterium polymorphum ATCC 10953 TaxID=393480 RepID=A5TW22_FUSNP|nr:restriction endonuclease subunit S [Fusobacterium polymorphum]EDK89097.1 type I site-specific deoxyribonuclease restriction subunit [Fusobacterium polymorphum ATCC 10953]WRL69069.1 restriction endonuclease subunit S [Fusobacterium polymorphum]
MRIGHKKILLKEVATFLNGYAFKPSDWSKEGLPIIRIQNLTGTNRDFNYYNGNYNKKYLIENGDILISWSASLGIFLWENMTGILNQHIFKVIFDKNIEIDKIYFLHCMKFLIKKIEKNIHGSTMKHITRPEFEKIKFPIYEIDIQRKISKKLIFITKIIENNKKLLNKMEELSKSLFTKYSKNKKVVNLELEEICEFIKDGTHQTPTYVNTNENGYKFLSSKDVSKGIINWDNTKYISEELHKELYKKIAPKKNDILLAKNGTTGIAALVDKEEIFDIYVSLAILRLKKEYNPKYILEGINSIETNQQFKKSLKGIGVPNLHLKEIKKVKIPIPPIELQNKFAERVEKIEKLKFEIEKSIEEAQKLYNSLISKYFDN